MQVCYTTFTWLVLAIWFTQSNIRADIIYFRPDEPIHMQTLTGKTVDFDLDFNGVVDFVLRSDGATFDTVPQDQNSILSIPATPPNMGADILQLQDGWGQVLSLLGEELFLVKPRKLATEGT